MHNERIAHYAHEHHFGQDALKSGERRARIVIALTATMMIAEVAGGLAFGSMALLADGIHMASHAAALGITALAYVYARRHARDKRYSFGTGKVNALAGFTSAVLLAVFALAMAAESIERFINPVEIAFNAAIGVAVVGLAVNAASALILGHAHGHGDANNHGHDGHEHAHEDHYHHHHDHNLRSAYLHVLADALTSLTAIFALLTGKYLGWNFMDPVMGIAGSLLVARWSWGLLKETAGVLLDRQESESLREEIRAAIESEADNRVSDLHVWSIGPGLCAAIISVVTHTPRDPAHYKALLPGGRGLAHVTVEVQHCEDGEPCAA